MDTCHYCGQQYHPMTVWTRPGKRIHVCDYHPRIDEDGELHFDESDCPERAELEGYERRRDLTPRR